LLPTYVSEFINGAHRMICSIRLHLAGQAVELIAYPCAPLEDSVNVQGPSVGPTLRFNQGLKFLHFLPTPPQFVLDEDLGSRFDAHRILK